MGEEGFQSLLMRSMFVTHQCHSWLKSPNSLPARLLLSDLETNFVGRELSDVQCANSDLLFNFIDLLASLIGEFFTTDILRCAWGDAALDAVIQEQEE